MLSATWRAPMLTRPLSSRSSAEHCASDVDGELFLHIDTTGLDMGAMGTEGTDVFALTGEPAGVIAGVASGGVFEGHGSFYIGLDAERPYRIALLEEPTRVVIDIDAS